MKMKKIIAGMLGAALLLTGCGKDDIPSADIGEFISAEKAQYTFAETSIADGDTIINSFAVMSDDTTAALTAANGSVLFTVYKSGKPVTETEISPFYQGLCYNAAADCFYSYDTEKKQLHVMDGDFAFKEVLVDGLEANEISAMNIVDNALYFVAPEKDVFNYDVQLEVLDEDTGYLDFGERAYSVDLATKKLKRLDIPNVICQSYSGDTLYYYCCRNGHYSLDLYDRAEGVLKTVMNMDEVGYIHSFAVIGSELLYIDNKREVIVRRDLNTGAETTEPGMVNIIRNSDFEVYKNTLIYLDRVEWSIRRFDGNPNAAVGNDRTAQFEGERLVIGGWNAYNFDLNTAAISSQSGISATVFEHNLTDSGLKLKLLAGDSDVDIYLFSSFYRIGRDIRSMGCYVPLTDEAVLAERSRYFDYLADYAVDDNGDIWCMPITADTETTFYVPENLGALGISTEELATFDGYFSALEKIKAQDKYAYYICGGAINFGSYIESAYNVNYSFLEFDDPLYRDRFERIYSGWEIWGDPNVNGEHPLFTNPYAVNGTDKSKDLKSVAFKCSDMYYFTTDGNDLSQWRAMALPTFSAPGEKVPVTVTYAIINPFSEKKEAAQAYLGFIAENHLKYIRQKTFIYKDKSLYDGIFDTSALCFDDLYDIFANGAVHERLVPIETGFRSDVIAYQRGEITLDEYIANLERVAEMAANE